MSTPQIDVAYIAKLARIDLTEEETALFSKDLDKILAYITKLESYDVTGIAPMNHPLPAMDVMREDIPETGFTQEEALSNAPPAVPGAIPHAQGGGIRLILPLPFPFTFQPSLPFPSHVKNSRHPGPVA